ncbi:MAG: PAS domain S-box protein [Caldilineaceae bacterium]|nr:PAS domain S-box protein [Caldilineaceae bacterium]
MFQSIRLLILETSNDYAERLIQQLTSADLSVNWQRVQTEAEFLEALEDSPDVILTDFALPGLDCLQVLDLLQARSLDIPLLVVSAPVGEELAVEAVKRGAADFLLRDRLAQLAPKVISALAARDRRTAMQQVESVVLHDEQNYRTLFEAANDGIFIADAMGNYVDVNPAGCQMLGYSRQELLQLNIRDIVEQDDRHIRPLQLDALQAGQRIVAKRRLVRKDGSLLLAEVSATQLPDGRLQGIVRDITKRMQMEEALRHSEAYYRAIVEMPLAQICRWKPDTTLTFANRAYADAYGCSQEELIGTSWLRFLPDRDREAVIEQIKRQTEHGQPYVYEHRVRLADGSEHWMFWTDDPIFDDQGDLIEFQSIGLDTTEHKQSQQAIHLLSYAVEQSPASVIITDPTGAIQYVNSKFEQVSGYTAAEVIGKNPRILKSGEVPDEVYAELWKTIATGGEWRGQLHNRKKNGELFWESVLISPIRDSTGAIVNFLSINEDITAQKEAEESLRRMNEELERRVENRTAELRLANVELERASRLKNEFLASMSHELRTPLTAIIGSTELLEADIYGPLNERQHRSVRVIRESSEHLLRVINDILDLAKIEAGQMNLDLTQVRVSDLCDSSLRLIRGQAAAKDLTVVHTMQPDRLTLVADARRLRQILVNLLSNAVKFTPAGGKIGLDVTGNPDSATITMSVWDTGIGISREQLPLLFQSFVQLDSRLSREYSGTGLGLALVRQMAELQGGHVAVESTPGQGSRFTVSLPWQQRLQSAIPPGDGDGQFPPDEDSPRGHH